MTSSLVSRAACGSDVNWQTTVAAYNGANTDSNLAQWWAAQPHGSFANLLAKSFGDGPTNFECGIGYQSSCTNAGCQPYQNASDPVWSYMALISVINLSTLFNNIYTGMTNGEASYTNLIDSVATTFFPWNDPQFPLGNASPWVTAILSIIFTGVLAPFGLLAGAGVQEASYALQPTPGATLLVDRLTLEKSLASWGSDARATVDSWANTTFTGEKDQVGNTILDYLKGGAFVDPNILPSDTQIEAFYTKQLISRTVNAQWKTQKIFVTFMKTDDPNDSSGPIQTRYYSPEDGGVYYTYYYSEDGILLGHLEKPFGLDELNSSQYNINGSDISKASGAAYRAAGFNFTHEDETALLEKSLASNGSISPFEEGAGWVGTWTLPVCDMGQNNWNTQYGDQTSRFGLMPCCCGANCNETKAFIEAANMVGFQTLLHACAAQLGDTTSADAYTGVGYSEVDYGFEWKKSYPLKFAVWPAWKRALSVIGCMASGGLAIPVLWYT